MRSRVRFFKGIIFSFLILTQPASAKVYDWVTMGRDDIRVVADPRVEAQLRLEVIRNATETIDVATWDQRPDDVVGMPLLDALEEAAVKGRKVRFILNQLIMPIKDPGGKVKARLKQIASRSKNFEYSIVGSFAMVENGWNPIDGTHEKLLITDAKISSPLPSKLAMTSGRGHGDQYLEWLDTGFLLKGNLLTQSAEAFDSLWKSLLKENPLNASSEDPHSEVYLADLKSISVPKESILIHLSPEQTDEVVKLRKWISEPPTQGKEYRARTLHFDFVDQMRKLPDVQTGERSPIGYSFDERIELLHDPVVEEAIELLKTSKRFKLTILAFIPSSKFEKALTSKLKEDESFQFELFTNSRKSHESITPLSFSVGWSANLPQLDDILKFNNSTGYLLADRKTEDDPHYIHRKLMIFEQDPKRANGREDIVIFGSHNLTLASSATLDELSFEIESNEFAQIINELYQTSLKKHGHLINKKKLHRSRTWIGHLLPEWVWSGMKFMY